VGSSGKKRTTMAKLNRESKLRDKRAEKQARKAARKLTTSTGAAQADSRADECDPASAGLDAGLPDNGEPESIAAYRT
jgi:hypothetical protein